MTNKAHHKARHQTQRQKLHTREMRKCVVTCEYLPKIAANAPFSYSFVTAMQPCKTTQTRLHRRGSQRKIPHRTAPTTCPTQRHHKKLPGRWHTKSAHTQRQHTEPPHRAAPQIMRTQKPHTENSHREPHPPSDNHKQLGMVLQGGKRSQRICETVSK